MDERCVTVMHKAREWFPHTAQADCVDLDLEQQERYAAAIAKLVAERSGPEVVVVRVRLQISASRTVDPMLLRDAADAGGEGEGEG